MVRMVTALNQNFVTAVLGAGTIVHNVLLLDTVVVAVLAGVVVLVDYTMMTLLLQLLFHWRSFRCCPLFVACVRVLLPLLFLLLLLTTTTMMAY